MVTDAGNDNASPLTLRLGHHDLCHHTAVVAVEVTDRLVGQQEIEGLAQGAHESHALLLAVAEVSELRGAFVGDAQRLEPLGNLGIALELRELVLDLHILPGRQLGEDAQFLEDDAQRALAQLCPVIGAELANIVAVESHRAEIVVAIANEIAAERGLARTRSSLDEIEVSAFKRDVLLPDVRMDVCAIAEDPRQGIVESDGVQWRIEN